MPLIDHLLIALGCPVLRLLQTVVESIKNAIGCARTQHDAKVLADQPCDTLTAPQTISIAVGLRSLLKKSSQLLIAMLRKTLGFSCAVTWFEDGLAMLTVVFQPLADRSVADPHCLGDIPLKPSFLFEADRTPATLGVLLWCVVHTHTTV